MPAMTWLSLVEHLKLKAGCPETTGFDNHEAWAQAVCACRTDFT